MIFNTLSGKKELLPKHKKLHLFVCGPTVYDYSHIGHARTYIAFDIIARYLKYRKIPLFYLQNITDLDDKIIDRAKERGIPWKKLAKDFETAYYQDMKVLGVKNVTRYARATDFIPEIIKQIKTLIKKGYAYEIPNDGWYFNLTKFPEYGKLSHRTISQASDGVSRIDTSNNKKNAGDFCLWKFSKKGEPSWKTTLGTGRPGWHIEDTAISEKFFGPQYDLHGGAVDLKFPHHEAEIAQQESASGKKPFVKIWMHTGFLLVNGEKMSKSSGNFTTIRNFLKTQKPETLRMIIASHHYRSPIDYTDNLANQASASLKRIEHFLARLNMIKKSGTVSAEIKKYIATTEQNFNQAMEDDFNTPDALASIFNLLNVLEKKIWTLNKSESSAIKKIIAEKMEIFGISLKKSAKIPPEIALKAKKRELCRAHKQFIQSDAMRRELDALGYIVEDTPQGPLVLNK